MMRFKPGQIRSRQLNGGSPVGWSGYHITQTESKKIPDRNVILNAVVSTWNDADIIGANVDNCFANGCSRVFILDNKSSDNSVQVAIEHGAEVGEVYETAVYDDDLRIRKQNAIVRRTTLSTPDEIWWMTLDADEFPSGKRVVDQIADCPSDVRVIGATSIDLYPTGDNQYVVGEHPAKCFTHGMTRNYCRHVRCDRFHHKHIVFSLRNGIFDIASHRGNHMIFGPNPNRVLKEAKDPVMFFHAPFRRYEDTSERLRKLCGGDPSERRSKLDDDVTGSIGAMARWKNLEDVYAGRWDQVEMPHGPFYGRKIVGLALYPWRVLAPDLAEYFSEENSHFNSVFRPQQECRYDERRHHIR